MPRLNDSTYSYSTGIEILGLELHFHKKINNGTGYLITEDEENVISANRASDLLWHMFNATFLIKRKN